MAKGLPAGQAQQTKRTLKNFLLILGYVPDYRPL